MLVGYSDSEGSDSESGVPTSKAKDATITAEAAKAAKAAKAAPAKLVDPATSKVKVNLANLSASSRADAEQDARPAKRQRVGGEKLDINAFLPPPKQPSRTLAAEGNPSGKTGLSKGLGRRVNLKTGAEPAFTRSEPSSSLDLDGEPKDINEVIAELRKRRVGPGVASTAADSSSATTATDEIKLVGNAMRFKPKSVATGPLRKKPVAPRATNSSPATTSTKPPSTSLSQTTKPSAQPSKLASTKAKVSLFSLGNPSATKQQDIDEMGADDADIIEETDKGLFGNQAEGASEQHHQAAATHSSTVAVDDLNLSQADMRQLFGRKAGRGGRTPDLSSINIVNFNADDQYAANEELRAKGETVQHNPVRGIAPGKHSLKQLVNAAATQADALEEHFAMGKRNQREAGSKYGW